MSKRQTLAKVLASSQMPHLVRWGRAAHRLTVLAYHRILDVDDPKFDGFEPNVSASPALFDAEMAYVSKYYNVISLEQLRAYVEEGTSLPSYPLLITFDDGYLDNYENALPILRRYNLPAVIFLMTSRMTDITRRSWWDEAAYYFHHTLKDQVELPLLGKVQLGGIHNLQMESCKQFVYQLKTVSPQERRNILDSLPTCFDIAPPDGVQQFVTWGQVNELVAAGVACQAHTVSHPILTEVSLDEVRQELTQSRAMIEKQTPQRVFAFAYPNGQRDDYNADITHILDEVGFTLSFTLLPGLVPIKDLPEQSLEISRVFLSHKDTLEIFMLKLFGLDL